MRQQRIERAVCTDTWLGSIEQYDGRFGPAWDIQPYITSSSISTLANVRRLNRHCRDGILSCREIPALNGPG